MLRRSIVSESLCAWVSITIWDSMVSSTAFHRFVFRVGASNSDWLDFAI